MDIWRFEKQGIVKRRDRPKSRRDRCARWELHQLCKLPEKTRELINKGQLFISNQFVSRLRDIAEISSKACDELAQQIADTSPPSRSQIKPLPLC